MTKNLSIFALLFFWVSFSFSQKTITGNVSDANGPLPGANILEQGTNNGVSTDFDGNYEITVEGDSSVIQISYTGFVSQSIEVGSQSSFNIVLEEDTQLLQEVVVTSLGFKVIRDEQGSTSSVISTGAVVRSGEPTLLNSLSGKASGVKISRSNADPGAGATIRIRGANTIDGASAPLFIVDGVPMNNSANYNSFDGRGSRSGGVSNGSRINDLNPNDIASLEVLKGAAAAAVWGSRAANGVVVITTKEGQSGKAKITFTSSYSIDEVSEKIPMQNTWGQGRSGSFGATRAESWGDYIPDRSGGLDTFDTSGQFFTARDGSVYYPITAKNSRETYVDKNWDNAFQKGTFLQNDLTISGGTDTGKYFFSLSNISQEGIIMGSDYNRTNLRFNYNAKLNDKMSLSNKMAYTHSSTNRIQQSSNTAGIMLGLLRTPPDFDNEDYIGTYTSSSGAETANRHRSYRRYLGNSQNPSYNNPGWTVHEQKSVAAVNRITATPELTIKPNNWLQIIARGNIDFSDDRRTTFYPIGSAGSAFNQGFFSESEIAHRYYNFDLIGRATTELSSDITLTSTVGWSLNDRKYNRTSGSVTGFLVNSTKQSSSLNTSAEATAFENYRTFRRSNRGYAVFNFDMFDQLYVNVSGGLEASSTIKGSFFYPSVDAAWNFTKSALDSSILSFGKLRATWGKVGVQPSAHQFQTLAEGGFGYSTYSDPISIDSFGGGYRLDNNLGNPNLEPEIKTEWEVGADLRFLDNDLTFGFTYYDNEIDGILLDVNLSPSSGFSTQYGNYGSMTNNGIELDLGWKAIEKDDLMLSTSIAWSKNRNEVTDLYGTESINLSPGASVSSRAIVGQQLGVLFGTGSLTNADGSYDLDENGFPQITPSPVILGDPNPEWMAGIGFNLEYKNLSLNVVVEHSEGGDFMPRTLWVLHRFGTTEATANRITTTQDLRNHDGDLIPSGTTVRGNVRDFGAGNVLLDEDWYRTGIGGGFGDNQAYNFGVYDATFTKVRELSLSYLLESEGLNSLLGLDNIKLTATGRNLININNVPGIDPETNQYGVGNALGLDYFTNPQTKSVLFTAAFNF
ncbi:MAG: SusC/RagA family TonB-linked outer membrane protein [Flavobacteriaceae bacterium]|nr:SusC/RagA family TonB-linked outer membrane protein [Flavobacteriaceae bacterium]|tara:strand:- start:3943 stop:7170 length:3228 start_codon:yes stop_codon:yes gene_type:complete